MRSQFSSSKLAEHDVHYNEQMVLVVVTARLFPTRADPRLCDKLI